MLQKFTFAILIAFTTLFSANAQTGTAEQNIPLSKLTATSLHESNGSINTTHSESGILAFVSVIRYKGKPIDICPVSRNDEGEWDFNAVYHRFPKSAISTEEALDLVYSYDWKIKGGQLNKDYHFLLQSRDRYPQYLTRTVEAIKLR